MTEFDRCASVFTLAALLAGTGCAAPKAAQLIFGGDSRVLRSRAEGSPQNSPDHPAILVLALDGVDRSLLYDMLRKGELPALGDLLGGGAGATFPHAYFDESLLSTLPSSTMAAWVTMFTGVGPATHGITGNEFFIREDRRFAAPAPVTFADSNPTIAIYTDEYLNKLAESPSAYQQMRAEDPNVLIWVAMHHFYAGADRLLLTKPTIIVHAFEAFIEANITKVVAAKDSRAAYEKLDEQVIDVVIGALDAVPVPDVLTVYMSGTDLYAHVAKEGPDEARRTYLREVVDPQLARLAEKLRGRDALEGRYVIVTADHGHTQVIHDDAHALSTKGDDTPPALLKKAGYRVRPFKLDVAKDDDFQAVLAYGGAMAYVYVADRSDCEKEKQVCDWAKPPRFEQDVLPLAEAFYKNNADGALVPAMKGKLDMILTRRPKPYREDDLPFEVYVGDGKMVPVDQYLGEHPHPTYVDVASRLRELAVGPHGERAGDILLIAHNGDRDKPEDRFYFAAPYRSWHGSPSRQDSEIPLIVAESGSSTEALHGIVQKALGDTPHQQRVTDLLLTLRRMPSHAKN